MLDEYIKHINGMTEHIQDCHSMCEREYSHDRKDRILLSHFRDLSTGEMKDNLFSISSDIDKLNGDDSKQEQKHILIRAGTILWFTIYERIVKEAYSFTPHEKFLFKELDRLSEQFSFNKDIYKIIITAYNEFYSEGTLTEINRGTNSDDFDYLREDLKEQTTKRVNEFITSDHINEISEAIETSRIFKLMHYMEDKRPSNKHIQYLIEDIYQSHNKKNVTKFEPIHQLLADAIYGNTTKKKRINRKEGLYVYKKVKEAYIGNKALLSAWTEAIENGKLSEWKNISTIKLPLRYFKDVAYGGTYKDEKLFYKFLMIGIFHNNKKDMYYRNAVIASQVEKKGVQFKELYGSLKNYARDIIKEEKKIIGIRKALNGYFNEINFEYFAEYGSKSTIEEISSIDELEIEIYHDMPQNYKQTILTMINENTKELMIRFLRYDDLKYDIEKEEILHLYFHNQSVDTPYEELVNYILSLPLKAQITQPTDYDILKKMIKIFKEEDITELLSKDIKLDNESQALFEDDIYHALKTGSSRFISGTIQKDNPIKIINELMDKLHNDMMVAYILKYIDLHMNKDMLLPSTFCFPERKEKKKKKAADKQRSEYMFSIKKNVYQFLDIVNGDLDDAEKMTASERFLRKVYNKHILYDNNRYMSDLLGDFVADMRDYMWDLLDSSSTEKPTESLFSLGQVWWMTYNSGVKITQNSSIDSIIADMVYGNTSIKYDEKEKISPKETFVVFLVMFRTVISGLYYRKGKEKNVYNITNNPKEKLLEKLEKHFNISRFYNDSIVGVNISKDEKDRLNHEYKSIKKSITMADAFIMDDTLRSIYAKNIKNIESQQNENIASECNRI